MSYRLKSLEIVRKSGLRALLATAWLFAAAGAQAQVGPPSLKLLMQLPGHIELQKLMILPAPPGAQLNAQATAFAYSGAVHAQAMHDAAVAIARGGVSVASAARLTGSGTFTNAARQYAASLGLAQAEGDVAQAVAAQMAVCMQAAHGDAVSAQQAAQFLQLAQARLAPQPALAQMSSAERQQLAEPLNVQTGLVYRVMQGRKRSSINNDELTYYCRLSLRALGFDLDKL